jgi:hypothetical protein
MTVPERTAPIATALAPAPLPLSNRGQSAATLD